MKYAHLKGNKLLGWYDPDIHKEIPEPNVEVEEEVWQQALGDNANAYEGGEFLVKDFLTREERRKRDLIELKHSTEFDRKIVVNGISFYGGHESAQRLNTKRMVTIEKGLSSFSYFSADDVLIVLTLEEAKAIWIAMVDVYESTFTEYKARKKIILNKGN